MTPDEIQQLKITVKNDVDRLCENKTDGLVSQIDDVKKNVQGINVNLTRIDMKMEKIEDRLDKICNVLLPDEETGREGLVKEHRKMYSDYIVWKWVIGFLGLSSVGGWSLAIAFILKSFKLI